MYVTSTYKLFNKMGESSCTTQEHEILTTSMIEDDKTNKFTIRCTVNPHLVQRKDIRTSLHELIKIRSGGHGLANRTEFTFTTDDPVCFAKMKDHVMSVTNVILKTSPFVLRNINLLEEYMPNSASSWQVS